MPKSEAIVEGPSRGPDLVTVPRLSKAPCDVRAVILERNLWEWERHMASRGQGPGHVHLSRVGLLAQALPMASCRLFAPKV